MVEYVDWFVDREKQYLGFQKMLARQTPKCIMLIEDAGEMGKSWLIHKMRHHCQEQAIPVMHVDFHDRRPHDYLSLIRIARDQLGPDKFNSLTATINRFTSVTVTLAGDGGAGGVGVNVADVSGANTISVQGEVAGRDIIKDNQFYVDADSDMAQRAAEIKINDDFFGCMAGLLAASPVVFLFDSYEDIHAEAERWLHDYLLTKVGEGQVAGIIVIVAGRKTPELGEPLKSLTAKTGLERFSEAHVREYIEVRRKIMGLDLSTIFKTSGGNPGLLAKMADVATMDSKNDDEWL